MDVIAGMGDKGSALLEELMRFRPDGLTPNGWAVKAGVSRTIWADLKRHGNPSRRTLEKLLGAAGMSLAEFEALRIGQSTVEAARLALADPGRGWRGTRPATVALFATGPADNLEFAGCRVAACAIDYSQIAGRVERPGSLRDDPDAYAIVMIGEAMWPRFRAGRRLLVSPAAAIEAGDDVLVRLRDGRVLIKELIGRTDRGIELRQFNPDATFAVDAKGFVAVHKVMGEAI